MPPLAPGAAPHPIDLLPTDVRDEYHMVEQAVSQLLLSEPGETLFFPQDSFSNVLDHYADKHHGRPADDTDSDDADQIIPEATERFSDLACHMLLKEETITEHTVLQALERSCVGKTDHQFELDVVTSLQQDYSSFVARKGSVIVSSERRVLTFLDVLRADCSILAKHSLDAATDRILHSSVKFAQNVHPIARFALLPLPNLVRMAHAYLAASHAVARKRKAVYQLLAGG